MPIRNRLAMFVLFELLALSSTVPCSCAYELRSYFGLDKVDQKIIESIQKTRESADQRLSCNSLDEIDVGIGESKPFEKSDLYMLGDKVVLDVFRDKPYRRFAHYFKREEVSEFLKNQSHKDLLVVTFRYRMAPCSKETLEEFNRFVDTLGYRRVLILNSTGSGIRVLRDTVADKAN